MGMTTVTCGAVRAGSRAGSRLIRRWGYSMFLRLPEVVGEEVEGPLPGFLRLRRVAVHAAEAMSDAGVHRGVEPVAEDLLQLVDAGPRTCNTVEFGEQAQDG